MKLHLTRPLAFFDIESTGTSPRADRIIDLAIVKLLPDGTRDSKTWRINPQRSIPAETTAIHGISNEEVADCPPFAEVADDIDAYLQNCDLAGYNILRFDIPMLVEEFLRAGKTFDLESRRLIDAQRIFHRKEPRDLSAALRFYCNEEHTGAHGAVADVLATMSVLEGQLARYPDVPTQLDELHEYCDPRKPNWVDRLGRLSWSDGEIVLNFGKRKGERLRDIMATDRSYIKWMLNSDFPRDTKDIIEAAMRGQWPQPQPVTAEECEE